MFSYFTLLKKGKKGQIFPVLIVIAVILIIAALISANLGKVSLDRLSSIQGADAGASRTERRRSRRHGTRSSGILSSNDGPVGFGIFFSDG